MASEPVRVAVVTGGNRGLGLMTCRRLAERGLSVVLTSRDEAAGQRAAEELAAEGLVVDPWPLDVTSDDQAQALADHVAERHGRLDVLVNNAGVMLGAAAESVLDADVDELRRSFEVNALGAWRCSRALVPLMLRHGYGRIVNVSSGLGALTDMGRGWPGYRTSKAALNVMTRLLSEELRSRGIKVNAVCPGHVRTAMGGADAPRSLDEGVDTTLWLATLHDDGPSGGFFRDCKAIPW